MIERLKELMLLVSASFRVSPAASSLIIILTVIQSLAAPGFAIAAGLLINAIVSHDQPKILLLGFVLAATVGARWLLGSVATHLTVRMQREVAHVFDGQLITLDSRLLGLEHHERPDHLAQLELLHDEHWRLGFAVSAAVEALALVIQLVASAMVLFRLQPALVALPLCGIPSLLATARARRLLNVADEAVVEEVRRERLFFNLGTSAAAAKEIRVFGLADEIVRRHGIEASAVVAARQAARQAGTLRQAVGRLIFVAGYLGAIAVVIGQVVQGNSGSVGDVVVVISLASQIWGLVNRSLDTVTWLLSVLRVVARIRWLEHYTQRQAQPGEAKATVPAQLHQGIDLVGVRFRYPETHVDVLEEVNLHLPAGSIVALVGDNGAGKSTLIKLLCRFYEPTAGKILIDGIDLSRINIGVWRQHLAGAFQDYARFELIAREVIGVGDLSALETGADGPELAALERAGTLEVITTLPQGLMTPLGSGYEQAVELSGGQWQKLALARARMRSQPLLLVLDEPTAALDPQSEHALFERFAQAAQDVREQGGITLLVSHRFSTVRMADLIVVVTKQRVGEVGTHEELMALKGLYAELYTLQARAYRSDISS